MSATKRNVIDALVIVGFFGVGLLVGLLMLLVPALLIAGHP